MDTKDGIRLRTMEVKNGDEQSSSDAYTLGDKIEAAHIENVKLSKKAQVEIIDSIAQDPDVTLESFAHLDIKKIQRKMDIRIVPTLSVLYLLSFLDRGNIGNAKIEGLSDDLRLTPGQYNWCLVRVRPRFLNDNHTNASDHRLPSFSPIASSKSQVTCS